MSGKLLFGCLFLLLFLGPDHWLSEVAGQEVSLQWLRPDLGSAVANESGSGIGFDDNGNVIVSGTSTSPFQPNACSDIYTPLDPCEFYDDAFNQVLWCLSQKNGLSSDSLFPVILATCNPESQDAEPLAGSANDIFVDTDGGFVITGACNMFDNLIDFSSDTPTGFSDAYLRFFNDFGDDVEFESSSDTDQFRVTGHSVTHFEGTTYVVGTREDVSRNNDVFVSNGSESVFLGTLDDEEGNGIAVNSSGIYVTGVTTGEFGEFEKGEGPCLIDDNDTDVFLMKLNFDMEIVWVRQFNSSAFDDDDGSCNDEVACSVAVNDENSIYVAGSINSLQGLLVRYNEDGTREWFRRLGGNGTPVADLTARNVSFADVAVDTVGGVYVVGRTDGEITPDAEAAISESSAFFARYEDSQGQGTFNYATQIDNDPDRTNDPFVDSVGTSIAVKTLLDVTVIYIAGTATNSTGPPPFREIALAGGDCGFFDIGEITAVLQTTQILAARFNQTGVLMKFELGDVNCDGSVDLLDVQPFVDLIIEGEFSAKADFNGDGVVDLLDIAPFVDRLISGGTDVSMRKILSLLL